MNNPEIKNINSFSFWQKWNIYQKERFPLIMHGILILAFSSSAVSFSSITSGRMHPHFMSYIVAFVTCLLFFLQLRIADEFKDYEEDCLYRSYRPVPQGIITLPELRNLFILASIVQLTFAAVFDIKLAIILLVVWVYLALMSREFGIKKWLKAHPITYMTSHSVIMPMVDFYATATDWIKFSGPPHALYWFVILSIFNGLNLEIGRKIRNPIDEEHGVETYSFLWGIKKAIYAWLAMVALTSICAIGAADSLPTIFTKIISIYLGLYMIVCIFCSVKFYLNVTQPPTLENNIHILKHQNKQKIGKIFETLSGLFTLSVYLLLGLIPLIFKDLL